MGAVLSVIVPIFPLILNAVKEIFSRAPAAPPPVAPVVQENTGMTKEQLIQAARERMGIDCVNYYNVAIIGESGVGKSTLINGLCGTKIAESSAGQGTMEPKSYSVPSCASLRVWDLPGCNTKDFPAGEYFERFCLFAFDALLLTFSPRATQNFGMLCRQATEAEVPCTYVRTQADKLLEDIKFDKGLALDDHEGAERELRFLTSTEIKREGGSDHAMIYIVSARRMLQGVHLLDDAALVQWLVSCAQRRAAKV